jgi:hypothetical protein|tara:strand:+ start:1584 stop:1916 length:333 start_codon:yes stop_codon:yes gene_type:complete
MAITQKLIESTFGTNNPVFTAAENVAITTIHLCNLASGEPAVINIYLLPNDGSTTTPTENNKIYNTLSISASDTYVIDTEKLILSTGDKLYIEHPDSTAQVVATISTIGL